MMETLNKCSICWLILILRNFYCCDGAAFFPTNSAYGIFAAIAVPLQLSPLNVFISYNFEANYNLPSLWDAPYIIKNQEVEQEEEERSYKNEVNNCLNCTDIETSTNSSTECTKELNANVTLSNVRKSRSLLSRTDFYHILSDKFQRLGLIGEPCLLRLICETNASNLSDINGVLGSIMRVLFSPSASADENLSLTYYKAEQHGLLDDCHHYESNCGESILNMISLSVAEIMSNINENMI